MDNFGFMEGDVCNRDGCEGVMYIPEVENCYCFKCAPCSHCEDNLSICDKCGENYE